MVPMVVGRDPEGARVGQMAGGTVALLHRFIELSIVWILVASLTGGRSDSEFPHVGYRVERMAQDTGHSLMRPLQWIGFAMLAGTDERWNKTILPMAFKATGMFFKKLPGVGIGVAPPALVGLAQVARASGIRKTIGIGEFRFVAQVACAVGMGRFEWKAKRGMQLRIDPALAERPVFIRRKVARLAIRLGARFKAMRAFVAINAALSFHQTKPRFTLLMASRAGGLRVNSFKYEIFIVIKKRGRLELVLVVAFFARSRGFAAPVNVFMTACTALP